ncbi:SGNH/GDSL hydrolase family protein [Agreia sp. PsM10]|uniref:SGNH/GDSL hydrolase family protein n=1 Tax=Agreia sp. PsM10 TaxID=3030533 RepID=UPI00263B9174|nr:SGNH/GDSL hydrolase family protein [Agreia sp. PsM10]MDN4641365.1 SGNH/GDSL hydrolase family protein [Agreia sp. PsM10]
MTSHITSGHTRARFISAAIIAVGLAAGSMLTASVATAAPAPGVPEVTAGLDYVALGDSYSAGLGLAPATGLPVPQCGQSAVDFPHRLATAYGLSLTDVSCSGATTDDVSVTSQYAGVGPQITALSADTDIVTVTIGGNDLGFQQIAASCLAAGPDGPLVFANPPAQNCVSLYNAQVDLLAAKIATQVAPDLAITYAAIAAAAPNAEVFVVGYPGLFPDTIPEGGCFTDAFSTPNSFPFTTIDTAYLRSTEQKLDAAIQASAANAGFTYVPTFAGSAGHSACAAAGTPYINGVTLSETGAEAASLHPNPLGETFLTDSVSLAFDAAFPAVVPTVAPTTDPVASGPATIAPKPALANTGLDAGPLVGGLALALLLVGGGFAVRVRRTAASR